MIVNGDSREVLAAMIERGEMVHSIVTDPPYGLVSTVKRFGKEGSAPAKSEGATGVYKRASAGFMGQKWDGTGIEQDPTFWRLCYDVLRPGGHLIAFGGTRTWHRIACAIEDAGFEVRDSLMWLYGTGFPKSHNDPAGWQGWGTALKPAWEPAFLFRKPLIGTVAQNVLAHGTGALNIDACRVETQDNLNGGAYSGGTRQGWGSATGSFKEGAKRLDPSEFTPPEGRWPANVIHDGSDEVEAAFAAFGGKGGGFGTENRAEGTGIYGKYSGATKGKTVGFGDSGSASRFFYTAKASKNDRNTDWQGNTIAATNVHPTVKPTDLMRWVVRLVTPPGGTVLDPFAGSGSTGKAARIECFEFIGIEADPKFAEIARQRCGDGSDFATTLRLLREAVERNKGARHAD